MRGSGSDWQGAAQVAGEMKEALCRVSDSSFDPSENASIPTVKYDVSIASSALGWLLRMLLRWLPCCSLEKDSRCAATVCGLAMFVPSQAPRG